MARNGARFFKQRMESLSHVVPFLGIWIILTFLCSPVVFLQCGESDSQWASDEVLQCLPHSYHPAVSVQPRGEPQICVPACIFPFQMHVRETRYES